MPARKNKTEEEKLVDSLNRLQGQLQALIERVEASNFTDTQQHKQINILFKAIRSALNSAYDKYRFLYLKKQLNEILKQAQGSF